MMSSPQSLSAAWYAALTLPALYGYWFGTEFFELSFEPAIFLPLLVSWLARRYPSSLSTLWLWLGFIAAFSISLDLTDTLSIGLGYGALFVLLAIVTTYTISRPVSPGALAGLFNRRWTWLKWLLPVALWLAIYIRQWPQVELGDKLELSFKPGLATLALVLLAGIDKGALVSNLRARLYSSSYSWINRMRLVLLLTLCILVFIDLRWQPVDALQLYFGFTGGMQLLYVVAIVLAVFGLVDWRLLIAGLLVFLALEWPLFWIGNAIGSLYETLLSADAPPSAQGGLASGAGAIEQIVVSGSRLYRPTWFAEGAIYGMGAILMATAFAPFVSSRSMETLLQRRTACFVVAALGVVLIGGPLFLHGLYTVGLFMLGIAAYLCGLQWKVRGLLLSPFVFQLAYLLLLSLVPDDYQRLGGVFSNVGIGLYSFAFAYFGFLSNRLRSFAQPAANDINVPGKTA